ncbi:MAG: Hdr-like menaquinol oxidoreductase cytochrome c subunit [Gammaproteobacteria bacterium]|nr:Hdr-like menaquinol oxidoreductase cytochrome c subunit [Gammaproteobacteria bacterium]
MNKVMNVEIFKSISWTKSALITLMLICLPAQAGVPMPDIPKGKGDKCVEETSLMRTDHMEMILHQRDETVHKGIRTKKHSFKECINCHAVKDENNLPVSYKSPKHFCNSCHTYAAVKIDCFECHASRPDNNKLNRTNSTVKRSKTNLQ